MEIVTTKAELRRARRAMAGAVGFAPTMGFLHDGHMALMRKARQENDHVIASIFVNPTQFGEGEDYESYPRDMDRDGDLLRDAGVDLLFAPDADEIYAKDARTVVEVLGLSDVLIGEVRPGHFRGVTTIVSKLFNLVQPDRAYFGEKDYQQLAILRQMVADLDVPVEICGVPIMREAGGLAMSSRNVRLNDEDRREAVILSAALEAARIALEERTMDVAALERFVRDYIAQSDRADICGVDVRDARTLEEIEGVIRDAVVVLLSVNFGDVFLIDNMVMSPVG